MQRKMQTQKRRYTKRSHCRHIWKRFASGMMSAVMLFTVCALILPAKALENSETSEVEGHVHGDACYTIEQGNLICQLAETEGHTHDSDCYAPSEQPVCQQEESEAHAHGSECYESELICTITEEEAHKHVESCYEQNKVLSCTEDALSDSAGNGDGVLSETPDYDPNGAPTEELIQIPEGVYTYSDDNIYVEVKLPEDTSVPADAVLKVVPIAEGSEAYESYVAKAEEAVDGAVENIALYDISFYTAAGEYISVDNTNAKVSLAFNESPVAAEAEVQVLHFADEEASLPEVISEVTHEEKEIEMFVEAEEESAAAAPAAQADEPANNTEEAETVVEVVTETRTVVEFTTDGFSTFAVIELTTEYQAPVTNLAGRSFIIAGVNFNDNITNETLPVLASENDGFKSCSTKSVVIQNNQVVSITPESYVGAVWEFEQANTGTYYIKNSEGKYLSIPDKENLTLSNDKQEFRVVAATGANVAGDVTNAVCIQAVNNGYCVNLYHNNPNEDFSSYDGNTNDRGNHVVLVECNVKQPEPQAVTWQSNLAGRSFIIAGVDHNEGNGILPVLTSERENPARRTTSVEIENKQVISATLENYEGAVWEFEQAKPGTYYIKNSQTEQYLAINGQSALGLANSKQEFRVVAATEITGDVTNAVCIQTADNLYSVNVYQNGLNGPFSSWNADTTDKGNHLVLVEYNIEPQEMITKAVTFADRSDLAGRVLVITNTRWKKALTSDYAYKNNRTELLKASDELTLEGTGNDYTSVTIPTDSNNLLWLFEDAGIDGQYYIKSLSTGRYLHIYSNNDKANADRSLTLEETVTPQPIEVYFTGNGNQVNLRYQLQNGAIHAVDWYDNNGVTDININSAYGFGVWEPGDNSNFVLTEYSRVVNSPVTAQVGNLDGKTMVITMLDLDVDAVLTNKPFDETNTKLQAQAAEENDGVLGVVSDDQMAEVKWTFTAVSDDGYYIQDSNGKYLSINEEKLTLTGENDKQPIKVHENEDGTFVLYVEQNGTNYCLNLYGYNLANGFGAWGIVDLNNPDINERVALTEANEFAQPVVTNLDGKTLALISIYDANTKESENDPDYTPKLALTSVDDYWGGLQGVSVKLEKDANGKVYTFDDAKFDNNNELWTFKAVAGKPGVYYIEAVNTDNGRYLNIGNGSADVSDTPQKITVLSDTYKGRDGITYDVVYLRAEVKGVEVYLRRELNGYGDKLYGDDFVDEGKDDTERNFVLAQSGTFTIDVSYGNGKNDWINDVNENWVYQPNFDKSAKETVTVKKESVERKEKKLPTAGDLGAEPVENLQGTNETQHFVYYYFKETLDAGTNGKGSDFSQAYMASWAPDLDADHNGYITPDERAAAKEVLGEAVRDPDDFTGESPYWGTEIELTHYEVIYPDGSTLKDSEGNAVKFKPGAEYKLNTDATKIAIEDENGVPYEVPFGVTFRAMYRQFSDILTFYVNLHGVVEDTAGDIKPVDTSRFTLGLAVGHIYYPGQYAGDNENDYVNANADIAALFRGAYGENVEPGQMHIVLDGFITRDDVENRTYAADMDSAQNRLLSNKMVSAKGASSAQLEKYVLKYIKDVEDVDIVLKDYTSGNNENVPTLNHSTIDTATFAVKWYVVKEMNDSWHIDGVTVGKTEPIAVKKTFYGLDKDKSGNLKDLVTDKMTYDGDSHENFHMAVSIYKDDKNAKEFYYMDPSNTPDAAKDGLYSYKEGSNPYNWTMNAILKQKYKLTEENYELNGYNCVSTVTVSSKNGGTETRYSDGTTAYVTGGETTGVEFKNYYTKENTGIFFVKKVDSESGLPLAGAVFNLTGGPEGATVNYTETTNADGEAVFYNLQPGTYSLKETKAPGGYVLDETKNTWTIEVTKGKVVCGGKTLYQVDNMAATKVVPLEIKNTLNADRHSNDLPQTGQLNWPVPVLAVGGLVLFAVGWMLSSGRKKEKDAE